MIDPGWHARRVARIRKRAAARGERRTIACMADRNPRTIALMFEAHDLEQRLAPYHPED